MSLVFSLDLLPFPPLSLNSFHLICLLRSRKVLGVRLTGSLQGMGNAK